MCFYFVFLFFPRLFHFLFIVYFVYDFIINITAKQTLLSGVGKIILLVHSLSNEKNKFTNKHYSMVLLSKSVYYKCF